MQPFVNILMTIPLCCVLAMKAFRVQSELVGLAFISVLVPMILLHFPRLRWISLTGVSGLSMVLIIVYRESTPGAFLTLLALSSLVVVIVMSSLSSHNPSPQGGNNENPDA